jgi:putative transposase
VPGASKAILFAILDDHSRLVCAARFVRAETTIGLDGVLRTALETRGIPGRLYVDNGAPYASGQLARVCAVLGARLVHSRPGRPQGRGKIERFFRTLRSQFLVELAGHPVLGLDELNRLLTAWIEQVYHRAEHSETSQQPIERYTAGDPPKRPDEALLREAFLWSQKRQVTKTATVSLLGNTYEVDQALTGRSVQLLYDPFNLERIEVRWQERSFGYAAPHQIARHVHPRASAELPPPPPSTGIDYLGLIAEQHERALKNHIAYRDIPTPPTPPSPGEQS